MKRIFLYILLVAVLAMVSSCKSSKEVTSGTSAPSASMSTPKAAVEAALATYSDWEYLSVPVKVEVTSPIKQSLSGRAYMVKDKSVYISLRFIGMEVATVYVTTDSLYATMKPGKYYLAEDLASILADVPLTVGDVQSAILGRMFTLSDKEPVRLAREAVAGASSDAWQITLAVPSYPDEKYSFTGRGADLTSLAFIHNGSQAATLSYTAPVTTVAGAFAPKARLTAQIPKASVDASLAWTWKDAQWTAADIRSWKMPKGYTRVRGTDAVKILSSVI
ncbi:MAG: DUF4292 domain-containing protein [Bacteroidales bacterium]|nr:DUF4292 domain-containing protein [Bacteroidales bacterium]